MQNDSAVPLLADEVQTIHLCKSTCTEMHSLNNFEKLYQKLLFQANSKKGDNRGRKHETDEILLRLQYWEAIC